MRNIALLDAVVWMAVFLICGAGAVTIVVVGVVAAVGTVAVLRFFGCNP